MTPTPQWKDRELEILRLLAEGLSDRAIGNRVNLSTETVRWYNKQLYGKLGVSSRKAAAARADALGLLGLGVSPAIPRPVEISPIRFVDNDGVAIAYQVVGEGPVDLLFINGFVSHLEISWEEPGYARFFQELGKHARVILFDKRGVGLSDRIHGASTLEDTINDALWVMRAVGSRRVFVAGTSEGGAAAVLLASMHPEIVSGLVLIATTPMPARRGAEPAWSRPWEAFQQGVDQLQSTWGEPWAIERFAPSRLGDAEFAAWWSRALRTASSPASARLILEQAMAVDIRPLLSQVQTRTLLLHRTDDLVVNIGAGKFCADQMPKATLLELRGRDHLYFVEPDQLTTPIIRFLAEPESLPEIDSWIAIVLHSAGQWSTLDEAKRAILFGHSARHVRMTADGWTALFDSPNRAIRCAQQLRALGRGRSAAMVLHVGACRTADGIPIGKAHEVAQRLITAAAPGEVLVSGTLRDILAGSEVELAVRSIDGGDELSPPTTVWQLLAPKP